MIQAEDDVAETGQLLHDNGVHAAVPAKTVAEENRCHFLFAMGEDVRQLNPDFRMRFNFSPWPENERASLWLILVPSYSFS